LLVFSSFDDDDDDDDAAADAAWTDVSDQMNTRQADNTALSSKLKRCDDILRGHPSTAEYP